MPIYKSIGKTVTFFKFNRQTSCSHDQRFIFAHGDCTKAKRSNKLTSYIASYMATIVVQMGLGWKILRILSNSKVI